jgi:hypothetical protein
MTKAEIVANLNNFKNREKEDLEQNNVRYMSLEERLKMEKSKLKVKKHF